MRRILLFLVLVASCLTSKAQVFSSISTSGHMLYFELNGLEATMTYPPINSPNGAYWEGYTKPTGRLIIPDTVLYYGTKIPVTRIGAFALSNCNDIASIIIPEGIHYIGGHALDWDTSLVSITFPASLDTIMGGCLYYTWMFESLVDTVIFNSSEPPYGASQFMYQWQQVPSNIQHFPSNIYIPCGAYDSYYSLYQMTTAPQTNNLFEPSAPNFNVNIAANHSIGGTVSITQQRNQDIKCDSSCIISATANDGYRFMYWSNGNTANPDTLFLYGDTTVTAIFSDVPDPEICMVSVQDNHNMVVWNNEEPCNTYRIYREGVVAGEYEAIADIPYDSLPIYIDSTSRPMTRSYRYRISALDNDNIEGEISPVHKTMHLTINRGLGGRWNLQWTPYEGAEYITYIIYRGTTADSLEQIDIMPADGNTSYTDETATDGDVFYQVGIVMVNGCASMEAKSASVSLSNIATNGSTQGIGNIESEGIRIYGEGDHIVVEGTTDEVRVYDMVGRSVRNEVLRAGVYMVKVGNRPARKVVVIR